MGLASDKLQRLSQFPTIFNEYLLMQQPSFGIGPHERPYIATSKGPESDQNVLSELGTPYIPQIITDLGLLIFQISNKLPTSSSLDYQESLFDLVQTLKGIAISSSGWKELLQAGGGSTSRSLIEELFNFSITENDTTLAEMVLQIGADPNQQICSGNPGERVSALDYAIRSRFNGLANLLLDSGAIIDDQNGLKHAILAGDFNTADRMLQSNSSLDVNFNYLNNSDLPVISHLGHLKFETVTLLGLVCLHHARRLCCCEAMFFATNNHATDCPMNNVIPSLKYLLRRRAKITLDTMIAASFSVDIFSLTFLVQQGGNVCGFNHFGFSCLAAACLRDFVQESIIILLLRSGAPITPPQTHPRRFFQASLCHCLCTRHGTSHFLDLLIRSGVDINHRIRHLGSSSQLAEAYEVYLWSSPSQNASIMDRIEQSKVESPLECAIIADQEATASLLVDRGCKLKLRQITLAAKLGMRSLLGKMLNHPSWIYIGEDIRQTCLRLALRFGHESIVRDLIEGGVNFGQQDIIHALQYPGILCLSTQIQRQLIYATLELERREIFGLSLLELCCLKFSENSVREILWRFPAVYDSGAMSAIVLRALQYDLLDEDPFCIRITEIQTMLRRRTEHNRDWEKENTALLLATMFRTPEVLSILVTPNTFSVPKAARLPKKSFPLFLKPRDTPRSFFWSHLWMDPTNGLGCQDWVACSPLMGIALMPETYGLELSASNDMLNHLLACGYESDALAVVIATANCKLWLLRRFQCLENWQSVMSIDDHGRPPWCPTALQVATSDENEVLVTFFLDAGVSVNEMPAKEPMGERMPRTALQAAVEKGNLKLMNLFIERGGCINAAAAEDSGATALQLACINGHLEMSLRLLELGADVNARGALRHGRTALEGAAEYGRIDTIQLLLSHGACTHGYYRVQYLKAVVYAEKNRHFAAAALLKEHREWSTEDKECYKSLQSDKPNDE